METAHEMALNIVKFTNSDLGVGITGKLNRIDENNLVGDNNKVFISVYNSLDNNYYDKELSVNDTTRDKNKELVINEVVKILLDLLSR